MRSDQIDTSKVMLAYWLLTKQMVAAKREAELSGEPLDEAMQSLFDELD